MSSKCFVINEWLFSDLRGENGNEKSVESFEFLKKLIHNRDRIAVLYGSPWLKKAYDLMAVKDRGIKTISRFLHKRVLLDSHICLYIHPNDSNEIDEEIRKQIPDDDLYLIKTYLYSKADAFITTDQRLINAISCIKTLNIILVHRDDFLKDY